MAKYIPIRVPKDNTKESLTGAGAISIVHIVSNLLDGTTRAIPEGEVLGQYKLINNLSNSVVTITGNFNHAADLIIEPLEKVALFWFKGDEWFIFQGFNPNSAAFFNTKLPSGEPEFINSDPIDNSRFSTSLDSAATYNLSNGILNGQQKKLITTVGGITVNLSLTGFTSISLANNSRFEGVWSSSGSSWIIYDSKGLTKNV